MVAQPLFSIRNLYCAYRGGKSVLHIPYLDLKRGEITFVLGASGIGKSTLIEALGLMNNTIRPTEDTEVLFFPPGKKHPIDLTEIWHRGNHALSDFRYSYYSFIFQQTNLMPNLTAGENMCLSMLIGGDSLEQARSKITDAMSALQLDEDLFDRSTRHLSGGQKQRATFVRAITAKFEVLFGDEPTGNLDQATAYRLMEVLRASLHADQRSAIIVTHDTELAFHFADRILLLTAKKEEECGFLFPEHQLYKLANKWINHTGEHINDPKKWVNLLLFPMQYN